MAREPLRYDMNERGLNRYARDSHDLKECLRRRAERGVRMAKAIAPIGLDSPNPGEFKRSIHAEYHPVRDRYGLIAGYRIVADSRDAVWAEFGRTVVNPYEGSHTLGKVAKKLNSRRPHRKI